MIIDLTAYRSIAEFIVEQRNQQKKDYKSRLPLNPNFELIGVLGEITYSICTGQPPNLKLIKKGDEGEDFKEIDIKTSEEYKTHYLIEFVEKIKKNKVNAKYYVYILIDLDKNTGRIVGWIPVEEFKQKSTIKDFGYGPRMVVPEDELYPVETFPLYKEQVRQIFKKFNEESNKICAHDDKLRLKKIEYLKDSISELEKLEIEKIV